LRKTVDTEACRNSVILRGSLPLGADTVQLKCKTQDVCLSMGEDCDITREDLVTIDVKDEAELTKEMVNLLWDCWWMMGEGKVDYISASLGSSEPYCSICSKVYFDDKIQDKYKEQGGISYSLIYNYMQRVKVPERDESFLFSIYGVNSLESIRQDLLVQSGYDIYQYKLDPGQEQVVVTAIVKDGWKAGLVSSLAIVGVSAVLAPFTFGWSTVIGGAVLGSAVGFTVESLDNGVSYLTPQYLPFKGEELKKLDCKEYVSEG